MRMNAAALSGKRTAGEKTAEAQMEGFFAWVHAMERAALAAARMRSQGFSLLGADGLPKEEALRFVGEYGAAFQAQYGTVVAQNPLAHSAGKGEDLDISSAEPTRVQINFMGVAGASGLLPLHYTRLIGARLKQKDSALADFIDIFNHRLIALFYRAWLKYRLPYQYEQARLLAQTDPITQFLQGLVGDRAPLPMASQLYFAGHFQRRCRSAGNLSAMLSALLSTAVRVEQFQGHWVYIDEADRSVLGSRAARQNRHRLGDGILLGKRYWDVAAGITIHIGPFLMQEYKVWLPGSDNYALLVRLIDRYVPLHIQINLQFEVIYEPSQEKRLGEGVSLKRTAWLRRAHVVADQVAVAHEHDEDECNPDKKTHVAKQWVRIANYRIERGQENPKK